mmetsp:Transcript_29701/g.58339  ORF Transcript_29701/g.58339 Transcript_29701/m.58339 type:complete len:340 (+) Transcript_29701:51-1070(+)
MANQALAGSNVIGLLYSSMVRMPEANIDREGAVSEMEEEQHARDGYQVVLDLRKKLLGPEHLDTLKTANADREGAVTEMEEAPELRRARERAARARRTAALVESEAITVKEAPATDAGMEVMEGVAEEVSQTEEAEVADEDIDAEPNEGAEEPAEVEAGEPDEAGQPEEAGEAAESEGAGGTGEADEADEADEVDGADGADGADEADQAGEAGEAEETGGGAESEEAEEAKPAVDGEDVCLPELVGKQRPSLRIAKKPACKAAPSPGMTLPSPKRSPVDEEWASAERSSKRKRVTLEQKQLLELRKLDTEDERERFLLGMSLKQRMKIATAMSLAEAGA